MWSFRKGIKIPTQYIKCMLEWKKKRITRVAGKGLTILPQLRNECSSKNTEKDYSSFLGRD
jgi:hypothetical protein